MWQTITKERDDLKHTKVRLTKENQELLGRAEEVHAHAQIPMYASTQTHRHTDTRTQIHTQTQTHTDTHRHTM